MSWMRIPPRTTIPLRTTSQIFNHNCPPETPIGDTVPSPRSFDAMDHFQKSIYLLQYNHLPLRHDGEEARHPAQEYATLAKRLIIVGCTFPAFPFQTNGRYLIFASKKPQRSPICFLTVSLCR